MQITKLELDGPLVITPQMHQDKRGEFGRIFCFNEFSEENVQFDIKQINHSITKQKGSVRGIHFQYPPKSESKLVKCIKGSIFDVIVDIRKDSPSFLQWISVVLSEANQKMLYIPSGFAHGFQTLDDDCELIYFHSDYYSPELEGGINYNDSILDIPWPLAVAEVSGKDKRHKYIDYEFKGI